MDGYVNFEVEAHVLVYPAPDRASVFVAHALEFDLCARDFDPHEAMSLLSERVADAVIQAAAKGDVGGLWSPSAADLWRAWLLLRHRGAEGSEAHARMGVAAAKLLGEWALREFPGAAEAPPVAKFSARGALEAYMRTFEFEVHPMMLKHKGGPAA